MNWASAYCAHTGPRHHDHAAADDGCHAAHGLRQQQLLGADERDGGA
ncbi:hypothetical protein [Agromyces sp. Soil535]|nr:hypothetical protein [Agromyces sp. Soil535]